MQNLRAALPRPLPLVREETVATLCLLHAQKTSLACTGHWAHIRFRCLQPLLAEVGHDRPGGLKFEGHMAEPEPAEEQIPTYVDFEP
jgi:hypothetical protein